MCPCGLQSHRLALPSLVSLSQLTFTLSLSSLAHNHCCYLPYLLPSADIYFDNVGGETLDAALNAMRVFGRIIACGSISQYNSKPEERYGLKNFFNVTVKQLRVEGFLVGVFKSRFPEAVAAMSADLASGKLKAEETVVSGFEELPTALLSLFDGQNVGKLVVKVA